MRHYPTADEIASAIIQQTADRAAARLNRATSSVRSAGMCTGRFIQHALLVAFWTLCGGAGLWFLGFVFFGG